MADAISIQELIDARTDAKTLEEAVNGDAVTTVLSRLGESYPTLANALSQIDGKLDSADTQIKQAITDLFQNGGLPATPFATKALMESSELVDGDYAMVTNDTEANNGLYVKAAGAWVKSEYDPLTQAKADATTKAETAKNEAIVESKLFTTSAIEDRDRGTPILTGQQIFDKSQTSTEMFTAIWSEYNKPIWHIGSSVFVDSVGAKVKLVEEEFVVTIKLVEKDQRFRLFGIGIPTGDPRRVQVDWGDGTSEVISRSIHHNYVGEIGDEFVITLTGDMMGFRFTAPSGGDNSPACLKSIDKNTLPKITEEFSLAHCYNLEYLCDGAFSSFSGESLNLELFNINPEITFNDGLFNGTGHVTNIDNILVKGTADFGDTTISPMLFSNFGNVTSAAFLFYGYQKALTKDNLKYLVNLEIAERMFSNCIDIADSNILDNQTKLINVNNCFASTGGSASALEIYNNMVANNPDITTHITCFQRTILTGLSSIPEGWK